MTITILDPRAEIGVPITPYLLAAETTRPGLRVALVSNGFYDASNLLNALGEVLRTELNDPQIRLFARENASVVAGPEVIADIAEACDVAVTALGHCGSCTSSATRDAVALARAGLPVAALVSEKFIETAKFVSRSVGMPEVPRVRLPHPVAGSGARRIAEIARAAAPTLIAAWRGEHVI